MKTKKMAVTVTFGPVTARLLDIYHTVAMPPGSTPTMTLRQLILKGILASMREDDRLANSMLPVVDGLKWQSTKD